MFDWLRPSRDVARKASDIYGAVVAQARQPAFYLDFGVPDTYVGRYEMIALHLALVLDRLAAPGVDDEDLRRALVECFVTDMDDAMREIGIGDMSVPRNVKKAANGLYERSKAYRSARLGNETGGHDAPADLPAVLIRHVYARVADPSAADASALARYVEGLDRHLQALPDADYREARLSFPEPRRDGASQAT